MSEFTMIGFTLVSVEDSQDSWLRGATLEVVSLIYGLTPGLTINPETALDPRSSGTSLAVINSEPWHQPGVQG